MVTEHEASNEKVERKKELELIVIIDDEIYWSRGF